jgi:hypothetical protein
MFGILIFENQASILPLVSFNKFTFHMELYAENQLSGKVNYPQDGCAVRHSVVVAFVIERYLSEVASHNTTKLGFYTKLLRLSPS